MYTLLYGMSFFSFSFYYDQQADTVYVKPWKVLKVKAEE